MWMNSRLKQLFSHYLCVMRRRKPQRKLAQDMEMGVHDQVYQPSICLVAYNTQEEKFEEIRQLVPGKANSVQ